MGRKIGGDVLMGNFQRGEVDLRARAEIEDELVAVAELDQPRGIGLRTPHERTPGSKRDDAHLVRGERLGVRVVIVASRHAPRSAGDPIPKFVSTRGALRCEYLV